jgi:hypothetical protein
MALSWEQVVIDAVDPVALGVWWADALGWEVIADDPAEFEIRPDGVGHSAESCTEIPAPTIPPWQ